MGSIDSSKDIDILKKLEEHVNEWPEIVERNRKFGIYLNSDPNVLKRKTYSQFVLASKHRELSPEALEWMGDFAENGPYDDIRQYLNNHEWVEQYRKLKAQK